LQIRGIVFFGVFVRIVVVAAILVLMAAKPPAPEDDREQEEAQRDRGEDQRKRLEDAEDAWRSRVNAEVDDRRILIPGGVVCGDPNRVVAVSVTFTKEMYHPFMPAVPVTCNTVTGGPNDEPLIRTTELLAVSRLPATSVP